MLFSMAVSLYTSRVILKTLGVEDFGIYNVVGGFVTMLAFLNNSMATSTQRFLNYEMGRESNLLKLQNVFSCAVNVHFLIGLLTVFLLETIGVWFVYNELNIPHEQFTAALWVYHFSVLSLFISILNTPYNAAIIANERMKIYAYYSIVDVFMKLAIVYVLIFLPYDKLILYGFLQLCVSFLMWILYFLYCRRHFLECHYKWIWDNNQLKSLFSFSGWMLFGCISSMLSSQGVNILINIFFGPIFNAARAIAVQVQQAVNNFVANFMTAVRPQIIKSYAAKDFEYAYRLVFSASKLSFYLLYVLTMPLLLYTEYILGIWLDVVPESSVLFTKLVLIELLVTSSYSPIAQINQASGKIKNYQIAISFVYLFNFILTYISFKIEFPVYSTFIISLVLSVVGLIVRALVMKHDNGFPAKIYILNVIIPLLPTSVLIIAIPFILRNLMTVSFVNLILNFIVGVLFSCVGIWCLGLNQTEKSFVKNKFNAVLIKRKL